ncbi:hypothetical protein [Ruminococcus sp.]|uniref:hypothetical protein n=1 Tax=Ruminococcus sp. TaxID=41978 RepID=UPI001B680724|nr:hypothetical protein [Ruminococcus sp.]MBP5433243.1 hypothetical protein [Ruminococcus sp.]
MSNYYTYDMINMYNAYRSPSTVHCKNTGLVNYYVRYLVQKVISVFEFINIPETWAINYFQYVLICRGYIGILRTDEFGVIPQECGLGGFNVFYQPKFITVANPLLTGIKQPEIGTECEVIKMQPDYGSIMDLVSTYADLMALCLESAGVNLLNSKLSYVFAAGNKTQAESFKKMFDKIASGEPAAFVDKNLFNEDGSRNWDVFFQNLKQNYVASDILDDMKTLEDQFNTAIGIPNANTQKRERLITDEVNANNIDTESKISLWLETMRGDMRRVNNMFGLDLDVRYRFADRMEVIDE